jgi:branched-subunit amino acid aminotransferase/4-amino-4-deoxychorismate lyase
MRITWSRGAAPTRSYVPQPDNGPPRLLVALFDELPQDSDTLRARGWAALIRDMAPGDLGRHKTLSAMTYVVALSRARALGADEAILVDAEGRVLEAAGSNVFASFGAEGLWTPPLTLPILPGLARARVLRRLPNAREGTITVDDLQRADEVFLTNTVRGVIPIRSIDGRPVGNGLPGWIAIDLTADFSVRGMLKLRRRRSLRYARELKQGAQADGTSEGS